LRQFPPSRIVCLTGETVETLYLLDEQDLIVGVSGYAVRLPQVRREKPRVSAFTSADIPKILALEPDLVLTFSDLQAPIAAELIRAGVAVHAFNQRDIAGILAMIRTVGALVGAVDSRKSLPGGMNLASATWRRWFAGGQSRRCISRNGTIRSSAASARSWNSLRSPVARTCFPN
jgi:iron complex transport system substrate-binding protein